MIEVRGLAKSFGDLRVVENVNFVARDGEITGLIGPNGAGKTTMFRLICTILRPDRGATLIDDSFNGNPASMVAALDSLKARPLQQGRRIAILGDMLELGAEAPDYHTALAKHLDGIDGVYCVGPLMHHLYRLLPKNKGLGWHEDPTTLKPQEVARLRAAVKRMP